MKVSEVLEKANRGEGLTVEEIKIYNANVKEKKHVYGKYGTLAKRYIEEHNFGKLLSLAGHLPEYLHGVDKAAEALYDVLWDKLSKSELRRQLDSFEENYFKGTGINVLPFSSVTRDGKDELWSKIFDSIK